ncbi:MAG: lactate racemase domain-containing protein [Patescibacteria group bacterium]
MAVDDLTRPTPASIICDFLVRYLYDKGVAMSSIHFFIATGAHRQLTKDDIIKKIGKLSYQNCAIHHHSPFCNTKYLGKTKYQTPIFVNKGFMEMGFKIVIGGVLPHSSVGFSGGAKLVVPGLSGIKTICALHRSTPHRKGKFAEIKDNVLRDDIDEAGKLVDVDVYIQVVCSPNNRTIAHILTGDDLYCYRKAVEYVKEKATLKIGKSYDIGIFNAYPLDTEFLQAGKAFDIMRATENKVIKENGIVILSTAASEGHGFHHVRSPDMLYPFLGDWTKAYAPRELIFFGENIKPSMLPEETRVNSKVFNKWAPLLSYLQKRFPVANVVVFPYASTQIPKYTGK